jgi:hypothetical protein
MAKQKQVRLEIPADISTSREKALYLLRQCKKRDSQRDLVSVRIDNNTTRLMPRDKAELFIKKQKNEK